jgi:hypothetical protein
MSTCPRHAPPAVPRVTAFHRRAQARRASALGSNSALNSAALAGGREI